MVGRVKSFPVNEHAHHISSLGREVRNRVCQEAVDLPYLTTSQMDDIIASLRNKLASTIRVSSDKWWLATLAPLIG